MLFQSKIFKNLLVFITCALLLPNALNATPNKRNRFTNNYSIADATRNWCRVLKFNDQAIYTKLKLKNKSESKIKNRIICRSAIERLKGRARILIPPVSPAPIPSQNLELGFGCMNTAGEISCRQDIDNKIYIDQDGYYCFCDKICCLLGDCCLNKDAACPGYECAEVMPTYTPTPTVTPTYTPYIVVTEPPEKPPACQLSFKLETGATYNRPDCPSGNFQDGQELILSSNSISQARVECYKKLASAWKECHYGLTPEEYAMEDEDQAITRPFVAFFWNERPPRLDHIIYKPNEVFGYNQACPSCLERGAVDPILPNDLAAYWAQVQMTADGLLKVNLSDIKVSKRIQINWVEKATVEISQLDRFEDLWKAFTYNYTETSGIDHRVYIPTVGDYILLRRVFKYYVSLSTHELENLVPTSWGAGNAFTRLLVARMTLRHHQHQNADQNTLNRLADALAKNVEYIVNRDIGLDKPVSHADLVVFYMLYFYPEKFDLQWPVIYGVRSQQWYDNLPEMILERAEAETSPTFSQNHANAAMLNERIAWEQLGMDSYFNNSVYVGKVLPAIFSAFTPMGVFGPKLVHWIPKFYGVVGRFYYEHPIIVSFIPVIGSISACIENVLNLTEGRDAQGNRIRYADESAALVLNSAFIMLEMTALKPLPGRLGTFVNELNISWKAEKGGLSYLKIVRSPAKMKNIVAAIKRAYGKSMLEGAPEQRFHAVKALHGADVPGTKVQDQMLRSLLWNKRDELLQMYNNQSRWQEWLREPWLVFAHFGYKSPPGIRIGNYRITDPAEFVAWLRQNGYDGAPIALVGCNTGRNPTFAQEVANLTGARVAATRYTLMHFKDIPNVFDQGSYFVFRSIADGNNVPQQIVDLFSPGLLDGVDYEIIGLGEKIFVSNPVDVLKSGIEDEIWKIFKPENSNRISRTDFATASAALSYPPLQLLRNMHDFQEDEQ